MVKVLSFTCMTTFKSTIAALEVRSLRLGENNFSEWPTPVPKSLLSQDRGR